MRPQLLIEVILDVVVIPVVLPHAQLLFILLLGAGPVWKWQNVSKLVNLSIIALTLSGELLKLVVLLEETQVHLRLVLISHY